MSSLVHAARPHWVRYASSGVLVGLVALALVWIGRANADEGGADPAAVSKSVINLATGRADAVDGTGFTCTGSASFVDLPAMSKTISFGGTAGRSVLVLFQSEFLSFATNSLAPIRLTIDGVPQGPANDVAMDFHHPVNDPFPVETHGFNFISDVLAPGTHTVKLQWRDSGGGGQICAGARSMIVLHK
jgi:hypothetical protein